MNRLDQLPAEIRLKIFAYTDLVCARPNGEKTGVMIHNGKSCHIPACHKAWYKRFYQKDCPARFPDEYLDPCRNAYYREMVEVAFSQNRLMFSGSLTKILDFLTTHVDGISHIRHLELKLGGDMIELWHSCDMPSRREWEDLILFIRRNLNLPILTLSVSAGSNYSTYEPERRPEEEDEDPRLNAYKSVIAPLRGLGVKGGLAGFYAFWPCYHGYEAEAEKEVMGPEYEPMNKVPRSRGDAWYSWWDW